LRIAAVSPTVRSGSRRETRSTAARCLLTQNRTSSVTAARFPLADLPVRIRAARLTNSHPGDGDSLFLTAAAQSGISDDWGSSPEFDAPWIELLFLPTALIVAAPSAAATSVGPGESDRERTKGDGREGRISSRFTGPARQARSQNQTQISGGFGGRRLSANSGRP
jgi:hypothetical protein